MALTLRQTDYEGVPAKNSKLTFQEMDNNFIFLADKVKDGDKGDITVSNSGATWTVNNTVLLNSLSNHGQCRLILYGSNLVLLPYNGNKLIINSASQTIPSAGVYLAPPATSGTLYYIYAYMNNTTMTLEYSTTTHATDTSTGVEIKSGNATRTLVGMARTYSSAWVDSSTKRCVRTWFNDGGIMCKAILLTRTLVGYPTNVQWVVLSSDTHFEWLSWTYEVLNVSTISTNWFDDGFHYNNGVRIDGSAVYAANVCYTIGTNSASDSIVLAEGYHYADQVIGVDAGMTLDWQVDGYTYISLSSGGNP